MSTYAPPAINLPPPPPSVMPALARFTVADYEAMIAAGILGEDRHVELVRGTIVDQMPRGSKHDFTLNELMLLVVERISGTHDLRTESPITLGDHSLPEPDLWIAQAPRGTYRETRPHGKDLLLVVEVADSSLETDRSVKLPLYAVAGIPEFWIINLREGSLERYRDPRADGTYAKKAVFGADQLLKHDLLGDIDIRRLLA